MERPALCFEWPLNPPMFGAVAALSKRHALFPSSAFHRVEIID